MKVLLLIDIQFEAEPGYEFEEELKDPYFATYAKALRSLKKKGHDVKVLGIFKKLDPLFEEVKKDRPDIIVNQADCFNDKSHLDKNIAWVLEMLGVPFTGASPTSLLICNNKALNKKI